MTDTVADTWAPRTSTEYAQAIEGELPSGKAWPRDPNSALMRWVAGCAQIWGDVDAAAANLAVVESDPRQTLQMLPDWERAFGLPDPCISGMQTISDRQAALVNKITIQGGQSAAFFVAAAKQIGYTIEIVQYTPYMAGVSRCGNTLPAGSTIATTKPWKWSLGPVGMRSYWRVLVLDTKLTWARAGSAQCGVQHMLTINFPLDLECMITRWGPAHAVVAFDFSEQSDS